MSWIDLKKVKPLNFASTIPFSFRKLDETVVMVNDYGNYIFLTEEEFKYLAENGPSSLEHSLVKELEEQNMLFTKQTAASAAGRLKRRFEDVARATNLHIIIPTLRCNLRCVYCQATAAAGDKYETDMSIDTARDVVNTIFDTPSKLLSIEFQGGEPLLNWETVKFIIEYSMQLSVEKQRSLRLNIVSNHVLMDDEKMDYLIDHNVVMCMSLDGPAFIHNKNRGDNHARIVETFKKMQRKYAEANLDKMPSLIGTLSKFSLPYHREIVDEYRLLNAGSIFVRPATTMGYAGKNWEKIGLTPNEFLSFYEKMLDYIIELNLKGENFTETFAVYILSKIIAGHEPGYVDMKSPCGATIGQLAYNYNGDVYTCDEGRMLGHQGDHTFRVGKCGESSYEDLVMHRATKACSIASTLETTPGCSECAYKPYCGVCPVLNHYETGELSPNVFLTSRHIVYEGIIDILFKRLMRADVSDIFMQWVKNYVNSSKVEIDDRKQSPKQRKAEKAVSEQARQ